MMIWQKLDNYCIKSGDFYIAKYITATGSKYGLSQFNKSYGYFATAEEAKKEALKVNNVK